MAKKPIAKPKAKRGAPPPVIRQAMHKKITAPPQKVRATQGSGRPYTPPNATRPAVKAVTAIGASARSGYAQDIMPERAANSMGVSVPIADASGRQAGRVPPSERQYGIAKYEVVDAEEAMSRMNKRLKGQLPPIKGGLDENVIATGDTELDAFEPGMDEREANPEEPKQRAAQPAYLKQAAPANPVGLYLAKRIRVTIDLPDTTLMIAATDAIISKYGVMLLLPTNNDQGTFVPKPGTEVTLSWGEHSFKCYFPGGAFELETLGLLALSFIRADG